MFAVFQLKCPCLVVVVAVNITWKCHGATSCWFLPCTSWPYGWRVLGFCSECWGICYSFTTCLKWLCGTLYFSKGETGNTSHHSLGERYRLFEEFKYQKTELHLGETSNPSPSPAATLLPQLLLLFLSEKVW